ncbi:MAG: CoA transferase [Gammaproteobacteria bacterium]|jgi:crotonobetainyl-CoA:carnitine CoA-transferase CaiB-like acyl-CoA transferase|nr:CoA transferase [Gammaproteobacteria bacterium]|tara:strand:+ start:9905 stop:11083 length:1179 start_codon:yes stop_codon:yes gene_type:complete
MQGPLTGFKILDLSAVLSGPLATAWLADQGAEVIKVEPLQGDIVRHMGGGAKGITPSFLNANRGKKSIAIDLKTETGVQLVKKLATLADVLVQNFRPGAIERMGLGYDVIKSINPGIVYCSISGFGETGPFAHKRVYDPVIQSLSGLADIQRDRDTGRPKMIRTVIPDMTTALTASQAITAALLSRERTGRGQHVQLAMIDAMIALTWAEGMAGYTVIGGEDKAPPQLAPDLIYKTTDGYITAGAVSDLEWQGMCHALQKEEWLDDNRFNTPAGRVKNVAERLTMTAEVIATRSSAHWLKVLDEHHVPSAPVLTRRELLDNEQIKANELIIEMDQPGLGRVRQPRPAARFSETPAQIQGVAPGLGEHSLEILRQAGLSDDEVEELLSDGVVK